MENKYMKLSTLIGTALLGATCSLSAVAGSLLNQYPHNDQYTLLSGEIVDLPLRVNSLQGVAIIGTINCDKKIISPILLTFELF